MKLEKSVTFPSEDYPDFKTEKLRVYNDRMCLKIFKSSGLLEDFWQIHFITTKSIHAHKGIGKTKRATKAELTKVFNEFIQAVASEFNIDIEGYVSDELNP